MANCLCRRHYLQDTTDFVKNNKQKQWDQQNKKVKVDLEKIINYE